MTDQIFKVLHVCHYFKSTHKFQYMSTFDGMLYQYPLGVCCEIISADTEEVN